MGTAMVSRMVVSSAFSDWTEFSARTGRRDPRRLRINLQVTTMHASRAGFTRSKPGLVKVLQQDHKQFSGAIIPGSENRPHFAGRARLLLGISINRSKADKAVVT
jgi:hypothetical protein